MATTRSGLVRTALLLPLLGSLCSAAVLRAQAPAPRGLGELATLVGVWEVTIKEHRSGEWVAAAPALVEATSILRGRFVAMDGLFRMPGHEKPLGMLLLFSQDPFQPLVRVSVLDDLVGLLDGFSGTWRDGELALTNLACDTPWQGKVYNRLILKMDGADRFAIHSDTSDDRGTTWKLGLLASFQRR